MFEINITNDRKSEFSINPSIRKGYDPSLHEPVEFENHFISIRGLRFKDSRNNFFENEKYLVFISGLVYRQIPSSNDLYPVPDYKILQLYLEKGDAFLCDLKGNFIVVIYNKFSNHLILSKDHLGLKYLYYKISGSFFYLSTNLNDFKKLSHSYNTSAIIEKMFFSYPIGNESYINSVYFLEQGNSFLFDNGITTIKSYYNIDDLFYSGQNLKTFDKEYFLYLFENSVIQRANSSTDTNVALTGGFDGRSIVAMLLKNEKNFLAYSFGRMGGENTQVPINVANKLGLKYWPIFLDEEYEEHFSECAMDALFFSDGISIFERANYIYAMRKLALHSKYNITGLLGGEVLAPIHLRTDYINETYYDIVYNQAAFSFEDIFQKSGLDRYINTKYITSEIESRLEHNILFRQNQIQEWKNNNYSWMYYLKDLVSMGFQRFYGNQMHLERYFNENLTPFYDLDLLTYIFSTNHIYKYKKAFLSNPFARRNNRNLQSLLIKSGSSALGEILVDRGYPPNYNLDLRKLLIPYHFYRRKRLIKSTPPDFISPIWNGYFFNSFELKAAKKRDENLFNFEEIESSLDNYSPEHYNKNFNQMLSVLGWINYEL